jgi:hypothetical protein
MNVVESVRVVVVVRKDGKFVEMMGDSIRWPVLGGLSTL